MKTRLIFAILMAPRPAALGQTNDSLTPAQRARAFEQGMEKIRADCVQGRRLICGKIVKINPEGLMVDSGFTNLMRPSLEKSWVVPGTAQAARAPDLVEGSEPGCVCAGLVLLTDLPRGRSGAKPKVYDYVVILGNPAGRSTCPSVGTVQRAVRRFAASLPAALRVNRDNAGLKPPVVTAASPPTSAQGN